MTPQLHRLMSQNMPIFKVTLRFKEGALEEPYQKDSLIQSKLYIHKLNVFLTLLYISFWFLSFFQYLIVTYGGKKQSEEETATTKFALYSYPPLLLIIWADYFIFLNTKLGRFRGILCLGGLFCHLTELIIWTVNYHIAFCLGGILDIILIIVIAEINLWNYIYVSIEIAICSLYMILRLKFAGKDFYWLTFLEFIGIYIIVVCRVYIYEREKMSQFYTLYLIRQREQEATILYHKLNIGMIIYERNIKEKETDIKYMNPALVKMLEEENEDDNKDENRTKTLVVTNDPLTRRDIWNKSKTLINEMYEMRPKENTMRNDENMESEIVKEEKEIRIGNKDVYVESMDLLFEGRNCIGLIVKSNTRPEITTKLSTELEKNLVQTICQEVRSPLNAISGSLEILEDEIESDNQKIRDCFQMMRTGLSMTVECIESRAKISKITGGNNMPIQYKQVNIRDYLQNIISLFQYESQNKGLQLLSTVNANVPEELHLEAEFVMHIIFAILSNSMKYTINGSISVEVWYSLEHLWITIEDTGVGIRDQDKSTLFTLHKQTNHFGGGVGLYLCKILLDRLGGDIQFSSEEGFGTKFTFHFPASSPNLVTISSDIMRRDSGSMNSISEDIEIILAPYTRKYNYKQSFSTLPYFSNLLLPTPQKDLGGEVEYMKEQRSVGEKMEKMENMGEMERPEEKMEIPDIEKMERPEKEKIRSQIKRSRIMKSIDKSDRKECVHILIVDDMKTNTIILKEMLRILGWEADESLNGRDAIERLQTSAALHKDCCRGYSLVLMDCNMPILNGYLATQKITHLALKGALNPQIVVVGVTAYDHPHNLHHCYQAGMASVLSKPVYLSQLRQLLYNYFPFSIPP